MTAFYMFRLYALTFQGKFRGTQDQELHLHESPKAMTIPLIVLAILAVAGGWIGIPEVFMKDAHYLQSFLAPVFAESQTGVESVNQLSHSTELMLMIGIVAVLLIVIVLVWRKFSNYAQTAEISTGLSRILENKWYVDEIYDAVINKPLRSFSAFLNNVVERLAIDGLVNGVGKAVQYSSRQLRLIQSGQVGSYILIMVVATVLFFIIQLFWKS